MVWVPVIKAQSLCTSTDSGYWWVILSLEKKGAANLLLRTGRSGTVREESTKDSRCCWNSPGSFSFSTGLVPEGEVCVYEFKINITALEKEFPLPWEITRLPLDRQLVPESLLLSCF